MKFCGITGPGWSASSVMVKARAVIPGAGGWKVLAPAGGDWILVWAKLLRLAAAAALAITKRRRSILLMQKRIGQGGWRYKVGGWRYKVRGSRFEEVVL